jgi:hypothetical protein
MKSSSGESANPHDYHTKIGKKLQALNVTNVDDNHLNLTQVATLERRVKKVSILHRRDAEFAEFFKDFSAFSATLR